jgi:putative isomerase
MAPKDFLDQPTMLMSKNCMAMSWSWNHCLNAMGLAEKDPELAWQQYMVLFDNKEVHGALPDEVRAFWGTGLLGDGLLGDRRSNP